MSKYNEVMDRIELTEDMQNRILNNIDSYQKKKRSGKILRYIYSIAACLILAAGIIVIAKASRIEKDPKDTSGTQGAYPFTEFQSIEELSEAFGTEIKDITELPFEVKSKKYSTLSDEFAQVEYWGKDDLENCCIRIGKDKKDISGDYNEYSIIKNVNCDGKEVTLKGNNEKIYLASWINNGHFYSVYLQTGVTEDSMLAIIRQIK